MIISNTLLFWFWFLKLYFVVLKAKCNDKTLTGKMEPDYKQRELEIKAASNKGLLASAAEGSKGSITI